MRTSFYLLVVLLGSTTSVAQENQTIHVLDERLKTTFLITYPLEFRCDLPESFHDLKECFSNLDSLESVLLERTMWMDEFLEREPDTRLEEEPKVYWLSEICWTEGWVEGNDTVPASMWCNLFPIGGTLKIYSEALELRSD